MNSTDGFPLIFVEASNDIGRYDDTRVSAAQIVSLAGIEKTARILDLPCGVGRIAVALSHLGYNIVGMDLSAEQIEYASLNNPGPTYLVGDMRYPPEEVFDVILNLYSSFGYFDTEEEDRSLLRTWHDTLSSGGRMLMELSDMDRARYRLSKREKVVVRHHHRSIEYLEMDWERCVLSSRYVMDDGRSFTCFARIYENEYLIRMIREAGFDDIKLFGGFDGRPKTESERAVILATKY